MLWKVMRNQIVMCTASERFPRPRPRRRQSLHLMDTIDKNSYYHGARFTHRNPFYSIFVRDFDPTYLPDLRL